MAHDGPTEINTAWTDGCFALFVLADVSNDVRDLAEQERVQINKFSRILTKLSPKQLSD
jgi:hypothetical protein